MPRWERLAQAHGQITEEIFTPALDEDAIKLTEISAQDHWPVIAEPPPAKQKSFNWLVSIPVWGERHVNTFLNSALPSIKSASKGINIKLAIHTNDNRIIEALKEWDHVIFPVPPGRNPHLQLSSAHRQTMSIAKAGQVVAFINADMVASVELFSAAEKRFNEGKRLIVMAGTRTMGGAPPVGVKSSELLRWCWANKHPWITETTWPTGKSKTPTVLFFKRGSTVIMRGFHLHPFATIKDRDLAFKGVTIDSDLGLDLPHEAIHVVTDCNEAAFAEISPRERDFGRCDQPNDVSSIVELVVRRCTNELHHWYFQHPIVIQGVAEDVGDVEISRQIMAAYANLKKPAQVNVPPRPQRASVRR